MFFPLFRYSSLQEVNVIFIGNSKLLLDNVDGLNLNLIYFSLQVQI